MKAKSIILAAILTLSSLNILFAKGNSVFVPAMNTTEILNISVLAPITQAEATFEEMNSDMELETLAPVTPAEATFEEINSEISFVTNLAPVPPAVAGFSDDVETMAVNIELLVPATPMVADFD